MRCGLLGKQLTHSFSPMIHAELGDYEYKLYEKTPEEMGDFLLHEDFDGLNVTVPYKKAVIPFCSRLSETARRIGSVNTLTRLPDGSLFGDNTDYFGFAYLLKKAGITSEKTVVLGSGGSSHTVQAVLRDMGVKNMVVVSRQGPDNYTNIAKHRDALVIINTTPVGMYPENGLSPLMNLGIFQKCQAVIDLIYNPARTELLLQAEERGMLAINGLAMLVAQAKKSAELFMGASIPDQKIETISSKILKRTQNIVLIGMPGCGKTSIGAALAKKMSRKFIDTDALVAESAGKTIPQLIHDDGEDAFRALETQALEKACKESGLVVATGGGIVKRTVNRKIIRQNGVTVFLDRDITELPTAGRPLSMQMGVKALAAERLPLYRDWADYKITVCGIEQTATRILEAFNENFSN